MLKSEATLPDSIGIMPDPVTEHEFKLPSATEPRLRTDFQHLAFQLGMTMRNKQKPEAQRSL